MSSFSGAGRVGEEISREGITLEFGFGSRPVFEQALAIARKHSSCQESGEGANRRAGVGREWLAFGHLGGEGIFHFDRDRIRQWVNQHLAEGYHHCPAFDAEFTYMVTELFPETINPVEDLRWRHMRKPGQSPEASASGVVPTGVQNAGKIARELQQAVRARRGPDCVLPTGKRPLPSLFSALESAHPTGKKSLFARVFGR